MGGWHCRAGVPADGFLDSRPGGGHNPGTPRSAAFPSNRPLTMKMHSSRVLALGVSLLAAAPSMAQQAPDAPTAPPPPARNPAATEIWEPVPRMVTPGPATSAPPPADAIILFDGRNLDQWVNTRDKSPAGWTVANGVITVNKPVGNIETRRSFTNYQLHIEWRVPQGTTQTGQARGNSGLFLASTGPGDAGYELQILDSYDNATYVNGQAASVYKQFPPLVNASRPQGEWQSYDVVWNAPAFYPNGTLAAPARVTVFHNGVLVQNNVELRGETVYIGPPSYKPHQAAPIKLQSHGDPSPPISFRNIWVREF